MSMPMQPVIVSYVTDSLGPDELNTLIQLIKSIYLHFYPSSSEERIRLRITRKKTTVVDVLLMDNHVCAFGVYYSQMVQNHKVLFRDGTMVDQAMQSKSYYKLLVKHSIDMSAPDYMVTRTQNPRVYESLKSFSPSGLIYPDVDFHVPEEISSVASFFHENGEFDRKTLVVKGVYTNGQGRADADFWSVRDQKTVQLFRNFLTEFDAFMLVIPTGH